jgi:hypothetical protein
MLELSKRASSFYPARPETNLIEKRVRHCHCGLHNHHFWRLDNLRLPFNSVVLLFKSKKKTFQLRLQCGYLSKQQVVSLRTFWLQTFDRAWSATVFDFSIEAVLIWWFSGMRWCLGRLKGMGSVREGLVPSFACCGLDYSSTPIVHDRRI